MRGPTGRLRRLRLQLCAGLLGLVVVGCTSEPDQPGVLPKDKPTTRSTSASPTPTTVEQEIESTVRAYLDEANVAFRTGETERLRRFTSPTCPCRGLAHDIRRIYQRGGRYESANYDVKFVKVSEVVGNTGSAEVRANVAPYKVFDGSGQATEDSSGGVLHTSFSLVRQESGRWLITNSFDLG